MPSKHSHPRKSTIIAIILMIVLAIFTVFIFKSVSNTGGSQKYLVIREWNVKFPLTAETQDAYYHFGPSTNKLYEYDDVSISLRFLDKTRCGQDQASGGVISRFTASEINQTNGKTILSENPQAKKVGDFYYYVFTTFPSKCTDDTKLQQKAEKARVALKIATSDLQAE